MDPALKDKIEHLPTAPGVYLMRDRAGAIVYVGKAVNLRARVRSYLNRGDERAFVPLLDELLGDVEVIVVRNEKEALLLENELIKRHQPRFNVMLRDDRSFICLKLDERAAWPRLEVVRAAQVQRRIGRPGVAAQTGEDGARYFGPYSSASAIRGTLRTINRHFGLRTCTDRTFELCRKRNRPCILYQIGHCPGPCVGAVDEGDYGRRVADVVLFLEGREATVAARIRERMEEAAGRLEFEAAAALRDQLSAVEKSLEKQRAVSAEDVDRDVFGVHRAGDRLVVYLLHVRAGRLAGGRTFPFAGQEFPTDELVASFVDLYYGQGNLVPDEVLLPLEIDGAREREAALSQLKGRRTRLLTPSRGAKAELVEMAHKNAEAAFHEHRHTAEELLALLGRLKRELGLARLPRRVECYDISLFQGAFAVGSMVTFVDGEPDKARYRRFQIRTVRGTDDFAMLYEVLSRRVKRGVREADLPDLFLIDGGLGQLASAAAALADAGVRADVVGLAKSRVAGEGPSGRVERSPERVFVLGRKNPVLLRQDGPELFLLARARDEAHRFAVAYHRQLRARGTLKSALDEIAGVGPARRRALLKAFGSVARLRQASVDEIARVESIGPTLAGQIHRALAAGPGPSGADGDGGSRRG